LTPINKSSAFIKTQAFNLIRNKQIFHADFPDKTSTALESVYGKFRTVCGGHYCRQSLDGENAGHLPESSARYLQGD
jgi:hypothetical protein